MATRKRLATLSLLAALFSAPLAADWLVTRDGGRFETRGKWQVEGNKVVFTLPNGTMGVLRKTEVDLDASAAASAEAASLPAKEEKSEKPILKPVLTLTDKDIRKAAPEPESGSPEAQAQASGGKDALDESQVVVRTWRQKPSDQGGIELIGVVRNTGKTIAVEITVEIEVTGGDGKVFKAAGFLDKTSLVPGAESLFRAVLPDVTQIVSDPEFKVKAEGASVDLEKPKAPASPPGKPPG